MDIVFSVFSPHPPILLPSIGSQKDRNKVKKTIQSLESLGKKFKKINPDLIIISSPHPDWGFNVPLFFLANEFKSEVKPYLVGLEPPDFYFKKGKEFYQTQILNCKMKIGLIASGDLSHCLKKDGPYGFNPQGPKFDKALIESLKRKDISAILKLNDDFPEAGECGLRSFCFTLGILEAHSTHSINSVQASSGLKWEPEILSYEGPFGVGYLVVNFKLK
ncbi:MAG: class III extradiol dioxygenase subunit B-like domain-containing protein [Candidatus Nealsonbacteria bacterium]|nr:class III extradiol dioxygenase subunit B-like domain-containing protein [Candidatus Nealsonbacteria bacterium]